MNRIIYIVFIILCLLICLGVARMVEARAFDWLLGGTREVVVEIPQPKYKLGDIVPEDVIDELIAQYATGTKAYRMKRTLYCESFYHNIQSYITKDGVREDSWGIAQIHLPSHPQVTREQALDPEFAIRFMSDNWNNTAWYGYSRELDRCN